MSKSDGHKALHSAGATQYMELNVFVDSEDPILIQKYKERADQHNQKIIDDPYFVDAGFDLLAPRNCSAGDAKGSGTIRMDFCVQCSATMFDFNSNFYNTGYYLYPRSSLSKTPLRLANSVGIIDSGYRGHIMAAFDIKNSLPYTAPIQDIIEQYDRVVQLCAPALVPIWVNLVPDIMRLGRNTLRGAGGFGSTGK